MNDDLWMKQIEQQRKERVELEAKGVPALRRLYKVAQGDSGQCRHIAAFLAGCYNGQRFPFDLTDLRCIDRELWDDCMAVLAMDRQPMQEVHRYFEDGSRKWESMIKDWSLAEKQLERARRLVENAD